MKTIFILSTLFLSLSAFAQEQSKCAKAIASLAGASYDLGIYTEKLNAAKLDAETSQEDPALLEAKINAMNTIRTAKKLNFNLSVTMIGVSCMNTNMLSIGSKIKEEVSNRFPENQE